MKAARPFLCSCLVIALVVAAGCEKKQTPVAKQAEPPPPVAAPTTEASESKNSGEVPDEFAAAENSEAEVPEFAVGPLQESADQRNDSAELVVLDLPDNPLTEGEPGLDLVPAEPAEEIMITELPPAFRMLVPTTAGPLIVDAQIQIGDDDLSAAFRQRIDDLIADANQDPESDLTWDELFEFLVGDPQQFGRQQIPMNRGQRRRVIQQIDANRNNRPDRDEVARLVFRSNGINVPFRLLGTDYFREINRSGSVLFAALDTDGNGSLDTSEVAAASQSLMRFDPNADQRIDLGEVIEQRAEPPQRNNDPAWNRRRSSRRGEVAMDLAGYVDWTMVSYALENMRGAVPFSLPGNLVDAIDVDQNESINSEEAKSLLNGPADVRLLIQFSADFDQPTIKVEYLRGDSDAVTVTHRTPGQLAIADEAFALIASVSDRQTAGNRIPREVFEMLDANNDGGLQADEIPDGAPDEWSFADLDADEDGKLTFQEINSAAKDQKLPIWGVQVRARGAEFPDAVFAWLDANHNGFLSTREILTAPARLRVGTTADQPITATDIPDTFALQFVRADPMQDMQQNFRFESPASTVQQSQPVWAQPMDTNRDGEISQVEFPGSLAQFAKLDDNGDGFISSDELAD
jgi:Ca2+-binding EF-hand superfamily protein